MDTHVSVSVLVPVYDDWAAARIVFRAMAQGFGARSDIQVELWIVDDGSAQPAPADLLADSGGLNSVTVLRLKHNMGHQRAIAIGLSWLRGQSTQDAVLVMDCDGEDRPEDVFVILDKFLESGKNEAVFAARRRRTDSRLFWLGYHLYRIVHWILTGVAVEIGNFSVLPAGYLGLLTSNSDLWSHYAAAAVKSKLPICKVPMDRGARVAGSSKMNYVSLTRHGLSALSVFGAIATARLVLIAGLMVIAVFGVLLISYIDAALTGRSLAFWDLQLIGAVLLVLMLGLIFSVAIAFTAAADRREFPLDPASSYEMYVESKDTLA